MDGPYVNQQFSTDFYKMFVNIDSTRSAVVLGYFSLPIYCQIFNTYVVLNIVDSQKNINFLFIYY